MIQTLEIVLPIWAALAVAAISPGPNMIAVVSRALGAGRFAALTVVVGIAFGGLIWATLSMVGLNSIFERYSVLPKLLACAGGLYLIWLGAKAVKSAWNSATPSFKSAPSKGLVSDFLFGLFVTLSNPKAALMWISLTTFVVSQGPTIGQMGVYAIGGSLLIIIVYGTYGLLFSSAQVRALYFRFQMVFEILFGAVFLALGASLFWFGLNQLLFQVS